MSKEEGGETVGEPDREGEGKGEIERIKSDVQRLSQDVSSAVSELKKSIIDIRTAISEIENPFNLLRAISSEEDLGRLSRARPSPQAKSLVSGKEEAEERLERAEETAKPKPAFEAPNAARAVLAVPHLEWVWSMLELGFSSEDIRQIALAYELLGFFPEGFGERIHPLALASERARSKGLNRNAFLLNMYRASAISGITIGPDDVERLISMIEEALKRRERE